MTATLQQILEVRQMDIREIHDRLSYVRRTPGYEHLIREVETEYCSALDRLWWAQFRARHEEACVRAGIR